MSNDEVIQGLKSSKRSGKFDTKEGVESFRDHLIDVAVKHNSACHADAAYCINVLLNYINRNKDLISEINRIVNMASDVKIHSKY